MQHTKLRTALPNDSREDFAVQAAALEASFCRRCCLYNCRQHAGGHVKPSLRPAPPPEWTPYDAGLLERAVAALGADACRVAAALDPARFTCADVKARLDAAGLAGGGENDDGGGDGADGAGTGAGAAAGGGRGRRGRARAGAAAKRAASAKHSSKAARKAVVARRFENRDEQLGWPAYTPCGCEGPCRPGSCSCITSGNFCEKFCGCAGLSDAACRFAGCQCTTGCRTNRCSCLLANRECDPDRCRGCAPTCDGTAAPGAECWNMNLRLRRRKRVVMSLSATHGAPRDVFGCWVVMWCCCVCEGGGHSLCCLSLSVFLALSKLSSPPSKTSSHRITHHSI